MRPEALSGVRRLASLACLLLLLGLTRAQGQGPVGSSDPNVHTSVDPSTGITTEFDARSGQYSVVDKDGKILGTGTGTVTTRLVEGPPVTIQTSITDTKTPGTAFSATAHDGTMTVSLTVNGKTVASYTGPLSPRPDDASIDDPDAQDNDSILTNPWVWVGTGIGVGTAVALTHGGNDQPSTVPVSTTPQPSPTSSPTPSPTPSSPTPTPTPTPINLTSFNGTFNGTLIASTNSCAFSPSSSVRGVLTVDSSGRGTWVKTHLNAGITFNFNVTLAASSATAAAFTGTTSMQVSSQNFTVNDSANVVISVSGKTITIVQTFVSTSGASCTVIYAGQLAA